MKMYNIVELKSHYWSQ